MSNKSTSHWRERALLLALLTGSACAERGEVIGVLDDASPSAVGESTSPTLLSGTSGTPSVPSRPHFSEPELISELCSPSAQDEDPTLTDDELNMLFLSERTGGRELYATRRATTQSPWSAPQTIAELNTESSEITPFLARDGLSVWYYSAHEPAGLWLSQRASTSTSFGAPAPLEELNSLGMLIGPWVSPDQLKMTMTVLGPTTVGWDLHVARRSSTNEPWQVPVPLDELNGPDNEHDPFLWDDERQLLMSSTRAGQGDLFWTWRTSSNASFEAPEPLDELNLPDSVEADPELMPSGTLYFSSDRAGSSCIYRATRLD